MRALLDKKLAIELSTSSKSKRFWALWVVWFVFYMIAMLNTATIIGAIAIAVSTIFVFLMGAMLSKD